MLRRALSTFIAGLLVLTFGVSSAVFANPDPDKERQAHEKIKAGIESLGVGSEVEIQLTLRNKTKVSGYLSEVHDEFVVIGDRATGTMTRVAYPDIAKVKGQNWSTKKTIAITAVIVGALAIIYFAAFQGKHL